MVTALQRVRDIGAFVGTLFAPFRGAFPKTHTSAPTIFIDKNYPRNFKGPPNYVESCASWLAQTSF